MKKTVILAFLLFFVSLTQIIAKHIIGGTISYKMVQKGTTSNRFAFTMYIYRDCSPTVSGSAPFDEIASIGIYDANKRLINRASAPLSTISVKQIGQCRNSSCVEVGTYQWFSDFPILTTSYTILYQRCCRSETISNIVRPGSNGISVALELSPAAQNVVNNSPIPNENLPLNLCVNQASNLDFSSTDLENDELKYSFYNLFSGGGTSGGVGCDMTSPSPPCISGMLPITYQNASFDKPLGENMKINEKTGKISGILEIQGTYALGIKTAEYRNDVLLSQSYLDYTVYAWACTTQNAVCFISPTIKGKVFFDKNNDTIQNADEISLAHTIITADTLFTRITDLNGKFNFTVDSNKTYTLKPSFGKNYFQFSPSSRIIITTNAQSQEYLNQDFAVQATKPVSDLAVSLVIGNARPGFSSLSTIHYKNVGTAPINATISCVFDSKLTFDSATLSPQQNGNTLTWNIPNIKLFEEQNINISFKTRTDAALSSEVLVAVNSQLVNTVDSDTSDNKDSQKRTVRGSYDPNDIQVDKTQFIKNPNDPAKPALPLTYTIRFQNTGNAEAYKVEVTDTLSAKFDIKTFETLATSHKYEMKILKDLNSSSYIMYWIFDNINLPDNKTNEKESHGFIKFQLKNMPSKTNYSRDSLLNGASIYFDFNAPIITNTAKTLFFTSAIKDYANLRFKAYPNPTSEIIYLESENDLPFSVEIVNNLGQVLRKKNLQGKNNNLDFSDLPNGFYFLKVQAFRAFGIVKVVKN
jgi:Secretion system C-terminal sorting domain